ncbi:hypothetical protein HDU67_001120 [Dinochytrium kinnereticum]|nr:hypothetical protein HDU67_001120 [Dinochytrium kinnereticum]
MSQSQSNPTLKDLLEVALLAGDSFEQVQRLVYPLYRTANQNAFALQPGEPDPLDSILDPKTNSLAYLYFLTSRLKAGRPQDDARLLSLVHTFANVYSEQVWIAPTRVKSMALGVCSIADRLGKPGLVVAILKKLLTQSPSIMDPLSLNHQLTSVHFLLARYCLLSKQFNVARSIIDIDISDIKKSRFELRIQDYLLYFYYGGIIYTHLKIYTRAQEFFELCFSTPSHAVSLIQIEAYRKCLLMHFIATGDVYSAPKYTAPIMTRMLQTHGAQYQDLAKSIEAAAKQKAQTEFLKATELLSKSGNIGLARKCFQSAIQHSILGLTKTYLTLPLVDIPKTISHDFPSIDLEKEVLSLIQDGKVLASISFRDNGMVSFHDEHEGYAGGETVTLLEKEIFRMVSLSEVITKEEQHLQTSKEFIGKILHNDNRGERLGSLPLGSGLWAVGDD